MKGQGGAITRAPNHSGGAKKSQQCHTYILQYSTFASGRPQVRKWGRQTCILPRAPSNLVTPLSIWRLVPSRNDPLTFMLQNHDPDKRKKKHNFPSPQKTLGSRVETNISKNSKAIIMLALCPVRCLLHHKVIEIDQTTFFSRHSGKHEVCGKSMTKFSTIQIFVRNATISRERNFRNGLTVQ